MTLLQNISPSIHLLPDQLINQIAAGEVIEDPASVVKELVENALDAKALHIVVSIKGGGLLSICVEDDGSGMSKEDVALSIQRHATSKIASLDDLFILQSMGFRGEALASIAAIAKVTIESAKKDAPAFKIHVEGGEVRSFCEASRTKGTTVEVKSLFFNVPVRKKFQKSWRANVAQIHKILTKIALSHPHVSLKATSDDRILFETKNYEELPFVKALENTIKDVLGNNFFSDLSFVHAKEESIELIGYIGSALTARQTRASQYLLINQRAVYSASVFQAIKEGYGTRLSDGYFPSCILHLQLPPSLIDVNVHPQKKEIRIREEWVIKEKISKAISFSLEKHRQTTDSSSLIIEPCFHRIEQKREDLPWRDSPLPVSGKQRDLFLEHEHQHILFPLQIIGLVSHFAFIHPYSLSFLSLEEKSSSVALVDLPAAYSRCLFESFLLHAETNKRVVAKQLLSVPILLDLTLEQATSIQENLSLFDQMGFEVRSISDKSICVDAIPNFVRADEIVELFQAILEDLLLFGTSDVLSLKIQTKLAHDICRFAKKRKKVYSLEESKIIIEKLKECKDPLTDPLGLPTYVVFTEEKLEQIFTKRDKA